MRTARGSRIAVVGETADFRQFGVDSQEVDLKAPARPRSQGWDAYATRALSCWPTTARSRPSNLCAAAIRSSALALPLPSATAPRRPYALKKRSLSA
jgi:hypothetical protein